MLYRLRGILPPGCDARILPLGLHSLRGAGHYDHEGSPYYSTARLWDDGVITATETRTALALGLSVAANVPVPHPKFGIFRM